MAKSKKDLGKMVDAQAKGRKSKDVKTDDSAPGGGKLDTRITKSVKHKV